MMQDTVVVWLSNGVPARIMWKGQRYRVNDTPTRLGDPLDAWWHPAVTHPPEPWFGWRFQAVDERGVARVFDVRHREQRAEWELIRVYD